MKYRFSGKANSYCAKLIDAFESSRIDIDSISSFKHFHSAIVKAGKILGGGKKGQKYNDFTGKIGFPLFVHYLINCELFTSDLGLHQMTSEWDLPNEDHGVDGILRLASDDNDLCTAQLKFKDNTTSILDRNKDNAGNFYESSSVDYNVTSYDRMIWITTAYNINKNLRNFTRVIDGRRIERLTEKKKKIFWAPFFDAIRAAAANARIQRPVFGVTEKVYSPSQRKFFSETLDVTYALRIIKAGCGAAKGDAVGHKIEKTFKDNPGSICAVGAAKLQLLGELGARFHRNFSSIPYIEATFSSRKEWDREVILEDEDANNMVFASTNQEKWVDFFKEKIALTNQNLLIYVCYASYEKFALMLDNICTEHPELWKMINRKFLFEARDEVHNLSSIEKIFDDPKEDRRLKRILTKSIPFLNRVFLQNCGFSATVPEFIYDHPELYGQVIEGPTQKVLQSEGITVPLKAIVITSADEEQNLLLDEDDKDLTYFLKCIAAEIAECEKTGIPPKLIMWAKSAHITNYFERKIQEKYPDSLIGSMTAKTPYKERNSFFDKFKSSSVLSVLLNYDIVSEGTDVDGATGAVIGRGLGDIKLTQIAGRPIRLTNADRAALRLSKIKPGVLDGWKKPSGRLYLYAEPGSFDSMHSTSKALTYLMELNEGGLIIIDDTKFLKKPAGKEPDPQKGVMDPPPEIDPVFQQRFFEGLTQREYSSRLDAMSFNELLEEF